MHTTKQGLAKRLVKMSLTQKRKRSLAFKTREKLVDPIEEEIKKIFLKEEARQDELLECLKSGRVPKGGFRIPLVMLYRTPDCDCDDEVEDDVDSEEESVEGFDELEKKDETAIHESRGDDGDYNEIAGSTDDEEAEALHKMKARKKRILASKGLEKDTLESKSKKKVEREDADES